MNTAEPGVGEMGRGVLGGIGISKSGDKLLQVVLEEESIKCPDEEATALAWGVEERSVFEMGLAGL